MDAPHRFRCTPAGAVARSRRRLRRLLLGLAVPMLGLAIWMLVESRLGAAALSGGCSFLAWFDWRMSGDLDPLWLELDEDSLAVQMRRRREVLTLSNAVFRPLDDAEIAHLHGLMTTAGMIFASGSFDSHRLGECDLFATDLDRAVLIEVDDLEQEDGRRRWVVTPDDPTALLAGLGAATSSEGTA